MKKLFALLPLIFLILACQYNKKSDLSREQSALRSKAASIDTDFRKIRMEVDSLAAKIAGLYEIQDKILPGINTGKYQMASNGVFTKPVDDGGSAIFVSGYYPIDENIKKTVYFTEPIDSVFRTLVGKYSEIVQVYYNDQFSMNRIYPYFDVLSQYEAKMDIPSFNFYYMADAKHNPEKKSLWLGEPYVDPAGRGWMVSAIAPVYFRGKLVGVPGIDVTINRIAKRYILDDLESTTMIIDNSGNIVTAQEVAINLLSFPPLFEHKYIETIKQDTYRKETYNLLLSKNSPVRELAVELLQKKKEVVETEMNGEKLTIITSFIPEMNWHILEIIR